MISDSTIIDQVTGLVGAIFAGLVSLLGAWAVILRIRLKHSQGAVKELAGAITNTPLPTPDNLMDPNTGAVIVDVGEHSRDLMTKTVLDRTQGLKMGSMVQRALADAKKRQNAGHGNAPEGP